MLLSLAMPSLTREMTAKPELLAENAPCLRAEGAVSLLIDEEKAVGNGADFGGESVIITGSNMSGKTTYLRTLGSLAVLAYAGAAVPAKSFALSLMDIYTSIQVSDDLSKGISTFYAELLRVRKMVEGTPAAQPHRRNLQRHQQRRPHHRRQGSHIPPDSPPSANPGHHPRLRTLRPARPEGRASKKLPLRRAL